MSHIGKLPIDIPQAVQLTMNSNTIHVTGPLGCLTIKQHQDVTVTQNDQQIHVFAKTPMWGTYRSIINNMIIGVTEGFEVRLQLVGVGYRAAVVQNTLELKLNSPALFQIPSNVIIKTIKPTLISVFGIDKQQVHLTASKIRDLQRPDPYKGKGVRYEDEVIKLKQGKK